MVYLPTLIPIKSTFHGGVHIPVPWDAMGCPYFPSPQAVELRGLELRHAAEALRRDKQVVLTAVKQVLLGKWFWMSWKKGGGDVRVSSWEGLYDEWWMMINDKWWRWMIIINYCIIMIVIIAMIPLCGRSGEFSANWSSCETWGEEVQYIIFNVHEEWGQDEDPMKCSWFWWSYDDPMHLVLTNDL